MGRKKGDVNKDNGILPDVMLLPTEARITLVANIIVEAILADQQKGQKLLLEAVREDQNAQPRTA